MSLFNKQSGLRQLEPEIQKAGYKTIYLPVDDDNRLEQLNVKLPDDEQGREYYAELAFASATRAAMRASGELAADSADDPVDYLQFYVSLPFTLTPRLLPEVAQVVVYLNVQLPLVGFGVNKDQERVYFRHMMMTEGQNASLPLVLEALDVIEFLITEFGDTLEAVASGSQSLEQALSQL